ncbi:hypothetical protein RHSIM_Rhsim03G0080100 [Rhododendron simsii]|uniref:ATPase AAA-type core domain-containing protein n=1 Tax=Rhododendron simsii TaxID=118357 RepID=A0A834HG18_RHOSS|nr:hypothetical protein RHSIM_Rhsim03G0080100 [Rhododendron simsii]
MLDLIRRALLRQKSGPGPFGSFLFLYGSGRGSTKHAKALPKQLFDDDKLLTEVDMSDYRDSDSISRLFGAFPSGEECGVGGLLTEVVKKRIFGVILLDNVDRSHPAVTNLLIKILGHGRLLDGLGNIVYFTNTLIVMTSNVVDYMFYQWGSRCWSQDAPMTDKFYHDSPYPENRCAYLSLLTEAKKYFKPELFEKLDEVIVFEALSYKQNRAVGRLQLRDIASSISGRRLILYPSGAALCEIVVRESAWPYNKVWDLWAAVILNFEVFKCSNGSCLIVQAKHRQVDPNLEDGGKAMKVWLEENVVPVLFDILVNNEIDDMLVVYIDALTGTKELSYRSEKRDFTCVADTVQKLLNAVDDLISNAVDALFVLNECILETSNCSNEETEPLEKERPSKRPMNQVQGLCMLLANRVVRQNQAIDVVAEALLTSILPDDLSHRPTMSLLFLGLTSVGQADLVRSLAENFVCDDGTNLFIDVDLSKYIDVDSLFLLLYGPLELSTSHGQHGFPLLELVQMRPHNIFVFSQVEQAHISVFSAFFSFLDQGTMCDLEGRTVDFRHTVVIFASDMGNSKILAQLVGHDPYDSSIEVMQQVNNLRKKALGLISLNQIDEIVCFNPLPRERLRKVARLSMRAGRHLTDGPPLALSTSILHLFSTASDPVYSFGQLLNFYAVAFENVIIPCHSWELSQLNSSFKRNLEYSIEFVLPHVLNFLVQVFKRVPCALEYTVYFSPRASSTVEATLTEVVGIRVAINRWVTN